MVFLGYREGLLFWILILKILFSVLVNYNNEIKAQPLIFMLVLILDALLYSIELMTLYTHECVVEGMGVILLPRMIHEHC